MAQSPPPPLVISTLAAKGIEVREFLGKGAYSTVWSVVDTTRGQVFAAKMISTATLRMRKIPTERLLREIEIMQRLKHPRIVELDQVIACGDDMLVLLMEQVNGRELFELILEDGPRQECMSRQLMKKLLEAVAYMHGMNVVHRDIKPENILVTHEEMVGCEIKLIDFGLGKIVSSFASPKSFVGTPEYFAPEVNPSMRSDPETGYTTAVDMWSIGIVLFVMLAGHFPQRPPGAAEDATPLLDAEALASISAECRSFLSSLLEPNPRTRLSAVEALAHPWFHSTPMMSAKETAMCCFKSKRPAIGLDQMVEMQNTIAGRFHFSYEMALGVPAVAMSIRMSAVHCREHFTNTTKLLHDMRRHAEHVIEMSDDVRVALEEGEPGLAVHFFQATASIIDAIKKRTDGIVANNARIMASLHEAIGLARLGGTMSELMDASSPASSPTAASGSGSGSGSGSSSSPPSDDERRRISFPRTPKTLNATKVAAAAEPLLTASMQKLRSRVEEATMAGTELTDEEMLELCFPMLQIGSQLGSAQGGAAAAAAAATAAVNAAAAAAAAGTSTGIDATEVSSSLPPSAHEVHQNLLVAANKLQEVDQVLMEAQMFWSLMQSAMETLLTRNEYIAGMLHFTRNAKMRERYIKRMADYIDKWRSISGMAERYLVLSAEGHARGFGFLNKNYSSFEIRNSGALPSNNGGVSGAAPRAGVPLSIVDIATAVN